MRRSNQSAVATLVDRSSRYPRPVHPPVNRSTAGVRDALIGTLGELLEAPRLTLTWEQGAKVAFHEQIAELLQGGVLVAPPPAAPSNTAQAKTPTVLLRHTSP